MNRDFTEQYVNNFEVGPYLKGGYSIFTENPGPYAFYRKGKLEIQYEIFKEGKLRGKRVLEIGSGPTIDFVIIPSLYFDEIYLADFNQPSRQEISKWLTGAPEAFDWSHHFKFISELEENGAGWQEREEMLRSKVKGVLHCDVLKENPLDPVNMNGFDCILTSNCLNAACTTVEDYDKAVANVAGLLKTGGHFVSFIGLGSSVTKIGSFRIKSLPVDEETFKTSAEKCGLKVIHCKSVGVNELSAVCKDISQLTGYTILHAVKE